MKQLLLHTGLLFCFVLGFAQDKQQTLFTKVNPKHSGITFKNQVTENDSLHVLKYEYLYNGHGVGVGDFNGDGLSDLFFTGNQVPSKLYINKGNFQFTDITKQAGIVDQGHWSTGVSIADVNGDGLPDIYVCNSGSFSDSFMLSNQLFINRGLKNGIPQFEEQASRFGLDAPGTQSTQAAFFDYDQDGDLDMFLVNHSNHTYNPFLNTRKQRSTPDMHFGNRLFRQDRTQSGEIHFTDVTLSAGIINNALNFGLSVTVSDINGDGWPDLYTTSDYTEKDCYYLNNKNGSFTESLENSFAQISKYSMGADIADYNNDGLPDVFTLDMLPEDNRRQKLLKGPDEYDQYHLLLDSGYYHQQMRNMLHLNQGTDPKGHLRFSEIGQLAGISNTDWSWSALLADFDNDGWKDLLVTNGYLRDFTDMDFLKYTVSDAQLEEARKGNFNFKTFDLVKKMPSNKLSSYLFRNSKNLLFEDVSEAWGITEPAISNGAAYVDLDNDGKLDLVICRNNETVAVYRNQLNQANHSIRIVLKGKESNTMALGAKLYAYTNGLVQMLENYPVRGYQSSVSPVLFFGTGTASIIDSIKVIWPGQSSTTLRNLNSDTLLVIEQQNTQPIITELKKQQNLFVHADNNAGIRFRHKENDFVDFKDEVLLPYKLSVSGPAFAKADVNGDELEDVFIGGAIEQAGQLYLQQKDGNFAIATSQPWGADAASEDVNAIFFDANGDTFPDLYVVSGGNEYGDGSPEFADRLYINDGKGNFTRVLDALPSMLSNKQAVAAGDFDLDGDLDLFVGGRGVPGSFPLSSRSYLLRNDTKSGLVQFSDVTAQVNEALMMPGMVTLASWTDLNDDNYPELLLAGDWMELMLFENRKGKMHDISARAGFSGTAGWWSAIHVADLDGDGNMDFILGNAGSNNQMKATATKPVTMFASDFDDNGRIDPIISYYVKDKTYPMASRDELLEQFTGFRKKYIYYKDYADVQVQDIFSKTQLLNAKSYRCEIMQSVVLYNNGNFSFKLDTLPLEAQVSRVNGIAVYDINKDGFEDLILAGNDHSYKVQMGKSDASNGTVLLGNGNRKFTVIPNRESGFWASGDIRNIGLVKSREGNYLFILKNNNLAEVQYIK